MSLRELGSTNVLVPVIGQGTWMIEEGRDARLRAVAALRQGMDLGLTHIDTAEMYGSGRAEELVGEAIADRRSEVFLASKVLPSNASFEGTLQACARSLKRLKTDWLDLYMLHWPGSYPIGDTLRAMEKLAADGLIRAIGVSNFDLRQLKAAEGALRNNRLAANQVLYHLGDRGIERRLLPYCIQQGISLVAYSPFGHDGFPSPQSPGGRVLASIAAGNGHTPRQVVLNFLTRHSGSFTIPKAIHPEHVRENAGSMGWSLSPEEVDAIDRAFPTPDHDTPLGML